MWVFECLVEVCPEHEPWGWCATCFHLNNCCRRFSSNQKHVFFFHLNEEFLINKHSLSPLMQLYFNLRATDQKKNPSIYFASIFFPQEGLFSFSWILLYASFMNHCKEMKNYSCYIHPFNTCTGTFLGAFQDIVFTHIDKVPFLISLKSNHNSTLIKLTAFFFFLFFFTFSVQGCFGLIMEEN